MHKEGRDRVELVCRGLRASEKPDLLLHAHLLPDAQPIELGATHAERLPEKGACVEGLHGHEELSLSGEKERVWGFGVGG